MARYKKEHPDYICIYGNVNDTTEEKTTKGSIKIIQYDGVEIHHYIGLELLRLILGENTETIIEFVKKTIDEYMRNTMMDV